MSEPLSKADVLGGWEPIVEMGRALGYRDTPSFRAFLKRLGVRVKPIRRIPHAQPAEFRAALERDAENAPLQPRRRGRPPGPKRTADQHVTG